MIFISFFYVKLPDNIKTVNIYYLLALPLILLIVNEVNSQLNKKS